MEINQNSFSYQQGLKAADTYKATEKNPEKFNSLIFKYSDKKTNDTEDAANFAAGFITGHTAGKKEIEPGDLAKVINTTVKGKDFPTIEGKSMEKNSNGNIGVAEFAAYISGVDDWDGKQDGIIDMNKMEFTYNPFALMETSSKIEDVRDSLRKNLQ